MAKIKIFQVSGSPRTPGTPDVSGALVPLRSATQFGKGISSFGKAVEAVAERLGFDYVFENNQQILLVSKGTDITEEVKKELGL